MAEKPTCRSTSVDEEGGSDNTVRIHKDFTPRIDRGRLQIAKRGLNKSYGVYARNLMRVVFKPEDLINRKWCIFFLIFTRAEC